MGNACTIHNTTSLPSHKPSPSSSLVYPPIPEFLQEIYSQYKIDCFSQVNSHSVSASALSVPATNATRSYKRALYTVNKQNLNKAIQEQASPGPSPSKKATLKSTFQFMKLSSNANQLSKEKWSKESSFIRQNPPSFHTSVSEIYDDGEMEYSRESESLKVEDLWQDVMRTGNSDLQKGLSERLAQHNLEDRRRSDSYLTTIQEGFAGKIINVEDYRRGSIEAPLQNNPSPPKKNLKKEEVKMFQFRVEKEENNAKIPMFGKVDNDTSPKRIKEVLEKRPENYILNNNVQEKMEVQQPISNQNEKEIRMAKSLTTVARSFSPVRRSQNASPEAKSDENPFREEKSLYSESVSPFEISPMRMQPDLSPSRNPTDKPIENYYSASKLPQSGFKPLVKYCSVGNLEPAQTTGLYDGIHNMPKSNQPNFKGTPMVSDADKMYASVQLYPTNNPSENYADATDRSKRDFGARKSSLMDRLMESLLEDRIRKDEPKTILETVEKETPSPSVRENPIIDKEKSSSYEQSNFDYNSRQRLDYTADQSEMSRSVAYKQPTPTQDAQDNNIRFLEKTKNVTSNILKEMDKDLNPFKRSEKPVEQVNKDSRETHNSLVSSAQVSRGASPHLKSGMLDVSREQILSQMEEAQKMLKAKERRVVENSFQKERGEIVTDQKAIVQEIKNLQREVFDRMSVVTSNMKGKMLTPKKMLELKDIQDKIKILTQLGTMIEAGEAAKQNKEVAAQSAFSTRRSISNMKDRNVPPKAELQQKSNKSFSSKEARNYFSCSKPSTTTSQTTSQNIKRNSSMTNINANVSTKNTYTSKPVSHQSTEPDTSLVIKPPSVAPSECKSTQEFLETENECIQNPKEVWKRPNSESMSLKPSKSVSYSSEPKSAHKHLTPYPAKELEPYQSVEPRPRRVTEVLSSSKSYMAHDLSIGNYSSVTISNKDSSSQLYTEKKDNGNAAGIHNMIKKLTQPKNLSTYATAQAQVQVQVQQQQKPAYRYANVEHTSTPLNPRSVKQQQQDMGARRLSTGGERPENRKPSTYKEMTSKSRVSSVEKIKAAPPVQDKHVPLIKNESQNQLKHNSSNKRLNVGNSSVVVKEYSMNLTDYREKSPAPKKPVENEKKQKMEKDVRTPENNENVLETPLETIMNDSKFENDQADLLYEEITKLDQKLAVTKSTGKIPLVEEPMEKSPNRKVRVAESSLERGNKGGSYIKQAARKSERHFTPLMGRVNRQSHNQSTEICERRQTVSNLSVQQEQTDYQTVSEMPGEEAKKGDKYNYHQSLQMRIKFAEEAARRQSVAESTEWILNAKLPLYAGKIQDKAKKNQG